MYFIQGHKLLQIFLETIFNKTLWTKTSARFFRPEQHKFMSEVSKY